MQDRLRQQDAQDTAAKRQQNSSLYPADLAGEADPAYPVILLF